ncbi:energy transducer TonB [Flavobacterium chungbukense]|uniref:TonB C-terminal domain-containing protein n=1 Tax=Flavobacterium chungbukense TaxID=877464 RepID=A0ABP7YR70_9FLAO|nr:energy transducer TonB [Flavobacterium chungbukense]MCC4919604.1 energy transducer TonB [Flavobacterium chungbukense]
MKKFSILILIFITQTTLCQNKEGKKTRDNLKDNLKNYEEEEIIFDENHVYNSAGLEILPSFPGGKVKLYQFIDDNYKKSNKKPTHQGKLFATFIIEKDGSLSDIKVLRDIGFGTGKELIRVLKLSPKWKPGKQKGKEVRTLYSIVIPVQI